MVSTTIITHPPTVRHVVQDNIYIQVGGKIYLLNEKSCEMIAKIVEAGGIYATFHSGMLYTIPHAFSAPVLRALHLHDRVTLWEYADDNLLAAPPRATKDLVYVYVGTKILALHQTDGSPIWSCLVGTPLSHLSAIEDETIYLVAKEEQVFLYAIGSNNGTIKWRSPLDFIPRKVDGLLVSKNVITLCSSSGGLFSFNASDGALTWKHQDTPVVAKIGTKHGKICTIAPFNRQKWPDGHAPTSRPRLADGHMPFDTRQMLLNVEKMLRIRTLLDDDGTLLWQKEFADPGAEVRSDILTYPVITADVFYLVLREAEGALLCAFAADSGTLLWQYSAGEAHLSTPLLSDQIIYLGSNDGYVHALHRETGALLWQTFVSTSYRSGVSSKGMVLKRRA